MGATPDAGRAVLCALLSFSVICLVFFFGFCFFGLISPCFCFTHSSVLSSGLLFSPSLRSFSLSVLLFFFYLFSSFSSCVLCKLSGVLAYCDVQWQHNGDCHSFRCLGVRTVSAKQYK